MRGLRTATASQRDVCSAVISRVKVTHREPPRERTERGLMTLLLRKSGINLRRSNIRKNLSDELLARLIDEGPSCAKRSPDQKTFSRGTPQVRCAGCRPRMPAEKAFFARVCAPTDGFTGYGIERLSRFAGEFLFHFASDFEEQGRG